MKRIKHKFSIFLLISILSLSLFAGVLSACSGKKNNTETLENYVSTTRMEVPTDSSLPTEHTALENIAYMATVLDNQPFYHAYASNSSKSMGYEQITQTWKDYKSAAVSGVDKSIMVTSDLSYSSLVKMSSQKLLVNSEEAYVRSGEKPAKKSAPTDIKWSEENPSYYDKNSYILKYGEFSTELTVFLITADTIESEEPTLDNGDGTYSLTVNLKPDAGRWYQYAMRTNGSLKNLPVFEKIELTFTFDASWQVLSTLCNEIEKISPKALGGIESKSTAKTTTTYSYSESDLDEAHLGYYESYYKSHLGIKDNPSGEEQDSPELLDVLGGGFKDVVNAEGNGQQFKLNLEIGETKYDGKIYLKLGDMSDILGSLQVRLALEKAGSGKQDLYVELSEGKLNAFYSDEFALTADFATVTQSIGGFEDFIDRFAKPDDGVEENTGGEASKGGLDLNSLLNALKLTQKKTSVRVEINTDDLLGLGIGVKLQINFSRFTDKEGNDTYEFRNLLLGELSVGGKPLDINATIVGDNSEMVTRNPSETSADLSDYISGVLNMLESETLSFDLSLDGEKSSVSYLDGISLNAVANVYLSNVIKVAADIQGAYGDLSLKLKAYYEIDIHSGDYGKIYLNITELGGEAFDIKLCCDIADAVEEIEKIISSVNGGAEAQAETSSESTGIAKIVNLVLNLNFGRIISDIKGNSSEISLKLNIDEVLAALGLDLGDVSLGKAKLAVNYDGNVASIGASAEALGLEMNIAGSDKTVSTPTGEYFDVTEAIKLVSRAMKSVTDIISSESVAFDLNTALTVDGVKLSVSGKGEVMWKNGVQIAIDATAAIAENDKITDVKVKLYYDTVSRIVKLFVNDLGFSFTPEEANEYAQIFSEISESEKSGNATAEEAGAANGLSSASVTSILEDGGLQSLISSVFEAIGNLSISLDKADSSSLNTLVVEYIANGVKNFSASLSADDKLSLSLGVYNNGGTEILSGTVAVATANGELLSKISQLTPEYAATKDNLIKTVYTYLFAVIDDLSVEEILDGKAFKVDLELSGEDSEIPVLKDNGVNLGVTLTYAEGSESKLLAVDFDVSFGISIEGAPHTVEVVGAVIYNDDYLFVRVDNITFDALVFDLSLKAKASSGDIYSAVEFILGLVNGGASSASYAVDTQSSVAISDILAGVLSLDFDKAFSFHKEDGSNVFALATDYVLETLGVNVGFEIGSVKVAVDPKTHEISMTVKNAEKDPWVTLDAYTTEDNAYQNFDSSEYLDMGDVVREVLKIKDEVEKVIKTEDITFGLDLTVTAGTTTVKLVGNGEVTWKDAIHAAVEATLTIDQKAYTAYFVYENGDITFVLSGEGFANKPIVLSFPATDADKAKENVDTFVNAFSEVQEVPVEAYSELGDAIANVTNSDALKSVVAMLCKVLNSFELTSNGNIALTHDKFNVKLTCNENINVAIESEPFKGAISAAAGKGEKLQAISATVAEFDTTDTSSLPTLAEQILDFIDETYKSITFEELLGSDTYKVSVVLDGDKSAIDKLKDISVNADIKVEQAQSGKLMEFVIDLDIKGTPVNLTAILTNDKIYLTINRIATIDLNGLRVTANISDLKSTVLTLVELISKGALLDNFTDGVTKAQEEEVTTFAAKVGENSSSVATILTSLLSLNLSEIFKFVTTEGETNKTTVMLDIDSIVGLFTSKLQIGTLNATVEGSEFNADLTVEKVEGETTVKNKWVEINANKTSDKIGEIDDSKYLDISFLSTFISDLANTLTDNDGKMYTKFTFTGAAAIDINVSVINVNIKIELISLTIGMDKDGLYVSVIGHLNAAKEAWYTVSVDRIISITYSGGYITLGRDLNTSAQSFKIMTFEYFLDTLTNSETSGLRWLLGTSSDAWSLIFNFVKLNIDSGLTKARDYYYYDNSSANKSSSLDIMSFIKGVFVKVEGTDLYTKGDVSELRNHFDNNCYAFSLDLSSLLGNTLKYLYVGLTRTEDSNGDYISGLKVYTNVANYVNVSLALDNYLEGETKEYGIESPTYTVAQVNSAEEFYTAYAPVELDEESYNNGEYYYYDTSSKEYVSCGSDTFDPELKYFKKANEKYYVLNGSDYVLAETYDSNATYYTVGVSSSTELGKVAAPNYFAYLKDLVNFDKYKDAQEDTTAHTTPIYGCVTLTNLTYNSGVFGVKDSEKDIVYASSNVLSEVTLTIKDDTNVDEVVDTITARYGSNIYLFNSMHPKTVEDERGNTYVYKYKFNLEDENTVDEILGLNENKTVYRVKVLAKEVRIEYNVNLGNLLTSVFLVQGDEIAEYHISGYSFLGWYSDENYSTPITAGYDGTTTTIYGKYVQAEKVVNGVVYKYDADKDCYYVSGTTSAISDYYFNGTDGEWLTLENEINGIKVKYIGKAAFSNPNTDANDAGYKTSLVNVIIPENIEEVQEEAFKNNKKLQNVVFLAKSVKFYGMVKKSKTKTTVFYGVGTSASVYVQTAISVYGGAEHANDDMWKRVKHDNNDKVNTVTNWVYAIFKFEGDTAGCAIASANYPNGFKSALSKEALEDEILAKLNEYTMNESDYDCSTNVFSVAASGDLVVGGNRITVTITENNKDDWESPVTVTVKVGGTDYTIDKVISGSSVEVLKEPLAQKGVDFDSIYAFYSDEEFTTKVDKIDGACTLHARVIEDGAAVSINGINYAYNKANKCYEVSGFAANGYSKYLYGTDGSTAEWLILESEINGIPVCSIKESAFSNPNKDANAAGYATSLVNVVVPESITSVGEMAFMDNKQLKKVVFLSDEILFVGDYEQSKSVFYGCWITEYLKNKINVNLTVYYNALKEGTSSNWKYCKQGTEYRVSYSTDWIYAQFTYNVINSEETITDNEIKLNGFYDKLYNKDELTDIIRIAIDTYLFETYGYSDAYEINVESGLTNNSNNIVVKLKKNESTRNPLNVTLNINGEKRIKQVYYNAPIEYINKFLTSDEIEYRYWWYTESTFENVVDIICTDIEIYAKIRAKYTINYSLSRDSETNKTSVVYCYDKNRDVEEVKAYKKPRIGGNGSVTFTSSIDVYEGETVKFSSSEKPVGKNAPDTLGADGKVFNFIISITDIHGKVRKYYFHAQKSNEWNESVNVTLKNNNTQTVNGNFNASNVSNISDITMGPNSCTSLELTLNWGDD